MIEFDGRLHTPDRIQSTNQHSVPQHAPPAFYHHHQVSHHVDSAVSHPRLNSLLTKKPSDISSSHQSVHLSHSHPNHSHNGNSTRQLGHSNSQSKHYSGGNSNSSQSQHNSSHHAQNGTLVSGKKGTDRVPPGSASSSKKHSQIVTKLHQSISSRINNKSGSSAQSGGHNSSAHSRSHSLPQIPTGTMSPMVSAPPTVVATKSSLMKISSQNHSSNNSSGNNSASQTANSAPAIEHESAAAMKKKKKSHLSRDELSRVCQNGDVTFEAYNGSGYMIAIRSIGDRKSLIGYKCEWHNCGYMNARVERMFGHIRSQHPEAPPVKKLVTTTGPSTTTSTVTTSTAASSEPATTTTTSARLSLRSSSSLSTASSVSSGSQSPRSQKNGVNKCDPSPQPLPPSTTPTPSTNSSLLTALGGNTNDNSRIVNGVSESNGTSICQVKAKKSSKPAAIKSQTPAVKQEHENGAQENTMPNINTHRASLSPSDPSPKVEASLSVAETSHLDSEDNKLIDLLNQPRNIKEEINDTETNSHEMLEFTLADIKVEHHSPLMDGLDSQHQLGSQDAHSSEHFEEDKLASLSTSELTEQTERIMAELKTISSNYESACLSNTPVGPVEHLQSPHSNEYSHQHSVASVHSVPSVHSVHSVHTPMHQSPGTSYSAMPNSVDRNNNHQMSMNGGSVGNECNGPTSVNSAPDMNAMQQSSSGSASVAMLDNSGNTNSGHTVTLKVENSLELFEEDMNDLDALLNEQEQQHSNERQTGNYQPSGEQYLLDTADHKFATSSVDLQSLVVEPTQHSPSVSFHGHGQASEHATSSPVQQPQPHQQSSQPLNQMVDHHSEQAHSSYDNFVPMNEYSSPSINENSLEYSASMDGKLQHHASIGSEQMMYDGDASYDMDPSLMMDDGSNGSNGSSGKNRGSKKTGSSKNYIGKQNLFQEFQSDDVQKVRDPENKYIIALQKNMKIVGYRCDWPECEFLTCRKYVMVNHINGKHTNQRPYSCPLCNFNFVKRYFLKAHMHKVHKRRISTDKDGEDEDSPIAAGSSKRDHDMMEGFDENQFDGMNGPDTPATPVTPVPSTSSSTKKAKRDAEPNGYHSSGQSYYSGSSSTSSQEPVFGQYNGCSVSAGPSEYSSGGDIPSTVQQYHSNQYNSNSNVNCYQAEQPILNGRPAMNGTTNGFYGDESYGSDISSQGNLTNAGFKNSQMNNSSAVFMTPSPSSSIASPLPFPANGPSTPNPKCGFGPMYDSNGSFDNCGQQAPPPMYPTNGTYNQPSGQQPFLTRSYSQTAQPSQAMYANGTGPVKSGSVGSNPMLNQVELLTPPLSVSSSNGPSCCRGSSSNDLFGPQSAPVTDSFSPFGDSSMGQSYQGNVSNGFEEFLSPPSSISSGSSSNFSGSYMNNLCVEQPPSTSNTASSVSNPNRQATVGGMSGSTPTSMATASSFYLHTPSPSPSSLSHSPASAPVYGQTNGSYNQMSSNQSAYPTNFSNTFNSVQDTSMPMSTQSYGGSSKNAFAQQNGGSFVCGSQQSNAMRSSNSLPQQQQYPSNQSQAAVMYNNSYDPNCYFAEEPAYNPVVSAARSNKSAAAFYGNGMPNSMSANGLFCDPYSDAYPLGPGQSMGKQMYSGPPAPPAQPTFLSNGAECWNTSW